MAKKTTTATTDDVTMELIKKVKQQKEEIAAAGRSNWITNCSFSYTENGANVINIHVEANLGNLIKIAGFLLEKKARYDEAAILLGAEKAPPFSWQNFPVTDWVSDIKMRITKLQISDKKKKLEALEERLGKLISPELRAQMELEAIAQELT